MSSQDFDLLNTNITPIDFDLEELMSIDSILPKSSHEIINSNSPITENNTLAKTFPIFTPIKHSYHNPNNVLTIKKESHKLILTKNMEISKISAVHYTMENIIDESEQMTDSIHHNMEKQPQSKEMLSNVSESQIGDIVETIISYDESEQVTNNDLTIKKPQIIEPVVTLAKLSDINKTDKAIETIASNDESKLVSNHDLTNKKPIEVAPVTTKTDVVENTKISNKFLETFIANQPQNTDVKSNNTTENLSKIDEVVAITPIKTDIIDKTAEPIAPKKVGQQQLNYTKTASHLQSKQPAKPNKILNTFFIGILFAVIGLLLDWGIHIVRSLATNVVDKISWLFFPCLTVIGLFFGFFFGTKALAVIFGTSATIHLEDTPDDGFATGLFKAIGVGIGVAIIGWFLAILLL